MYLGAASGVAVRELPLPAGPTDYLLFVHSKMIGVVEAKPVGTTLSGVETQSAKYGTGLRVKANVLFFDHRPASERPWTQRLWIYPVHLQSPR
jgi:type I site-specific restriction endonuclease